MIRARVSNRGVLAGAMTLSLLLAGTVQAQTNPPSCSLDPQSVADALLAGGTRLGPPFALRDRQGIRTGAVWDAASLVGAARAVGNLAYATCTDASGNASSEKATVVVSHLP